MQKYLVFLLVLIFANCQPKEEVMPKHELLSLLSTNIDQLQVVNFWSITCKPCIVEMPQFSLLVFSLTIYTRCC